MVSAYHICYLLKKNGSTGLDTAEAINELKQEGGVLSVLDREIELHKVR